MQWCTAPQFSNINIILTQNVGVPLPVHQYRKNCLCVLVGGKGGQGEGCSGKERIIEGKAGPEKTKQRGIEGWSRKMCTSSRKKNV